MSTQPDFCIMRDTKGEGLAKVSRKPESRGWWDSETPCPLIIKAKVGPT